jgi:hypothetical protein
LGTDRSSTRFFCASAARWTFSFSFLVIKPLELRPI